MFSPVGLNAAIVARLGACDMTPAEPRRIRANIKMQMIRMYMHDLTGHFTDDPGTFGRMVVDQGKGLATAHPIGWAQHIVNCTTVEAVEFCRCELETVYAQLVAWKLPTTMEVKQASSTSK